MNLPLVLAGLAMGAAASPHCAAMCGAPCAALTRHGSAHAAGFHGGRVIGYAVGGAVAATSVAALGTWSQSVPVLRPLWTLLHLGFLALGLWWLTTGRQPDWLQRRATNVVHVVARPGRPMRAGLAGLAWVAWPCGALQAALLLSSLGQTALDGALVMAAFAVGSMPALGLAPWLWRRWQSLKTLRYFPVPRFGSLAER